MSEEDQERLEDYLELEHFIEELQAGRAAHPPEGLSPEKARIYRMAALLRSASPDEAAPRAEFAAELQAKLEHEGQQPPRTRHLPFLARKPQGRARVSRRAVLAGGAAAVAASLAVGAGLEHVVEQAANTGTPPASQWSTPIVPAGIASTWLFVTTVAELGDKAVRFATDAIVGYVIRNDGDDKAAGNEPVVAVSATCTHMGCLVHWQDTDHKFHCPCHGGLFTEYGMIDTRSPLLYLKPLPRFETKVEEGKVFVRVPAGQTS
jgi:Rieske Fe-S protein